MSFNQARQALTALPALLDAADGLCDVLERKARPEDLWAKVVATAPAALLEELQGIKTAADVEALLLRIAHLPGLVWILGARKARLLEASILATGNGRRVAERLAELIQGAAGASPGGPPT